MKSFAAAGFLALFCVCLASYLAFAATFGRFVQMDEVFFKAAGREWAASGHFAAPEIHGVPTADPPGFLVMQPPLSEIWFAQLPGYTFAFGVFARLFGFGPEQCVMYDALIHATLALLTFLTCRRLTRDQYPALAVLAGLAVLPLGTLARPDELAMCLGLAGTLPFLEETLDAKRVAFSGLLFGLCAATSAGAAILLGIVTMPFFAPHWRSPARAAALLTIWIASAAVTFAGALAPILIAHPDALHQFVGHASGHFWHGRYRQAFLKTWTFGVPYLAVACGGLIVAAVSLPAWKRERSAWMRLWIGPLAAIVFLAIFLPDKYLYLWFIGPMTLVATILTLHSLRQRSAAGIMRPLGLALACCYAMAIAPCLQATINIVAIPPAQRLERNARLVRELVPGGSTVVTDDDWWILAERCRVYDPYFSRPRPEEVDFIILGGDGSGDPRRMRDVPENLASYAAKHFTCVMNELNDQPVRVLGRPLGHTGQGFGVYVLGRRDTSFKPPALAHYDRTSRQSDR